MQLFNQALVLLLVLTAIPVGALADDHAAILAPYLNGDTFAAGYLDLAALPKSDANDDSLFALLPQLNEEAQAWVLALKGIGDFVGRLQTAGVESVYVMFGLGDVNMPGGPIVVLPMSAAGDQRDVENVLKPILPSLASMGGDDSWGDWLRGLQVRSQGIEAVLVGTPATLDRYTSLTKSARKDLVEPLEKLSSEDAIVAGIFSPGPDFRRVVRELWPTLPSPLTPLKGELADRWLRLELAANLPPDAKPRITLHASDAAAAQTFVDLYREIPAAVDKFASLGVHREAVTQKVEDIIAVAPAEIEGNRVTINITTDGPQLAKLQSLVNDAIDAAMQSTRNRQRLDQMKQLAMAMHKYHDINKHFPPAAIRDKDGRPLLSWRVAVLPYLEQNELYKQFHLDEPWDSPHNRTLVDKMPAGFADPDTKIRGLAGNGKTTFQVPVGAATIFFDNIGTKYGQITDGTSKTILILEVVPEQAAIWTQPDDWEIDMQNVRQGIARSDRTSFVAAYADGSVQTIPTDADENVLRANLTRGGREVVDRP